jgi:hypothetical protein
LKWRVSDSLWERLAPILTDPPRRFRYPGRARYGPRQCLEGILYVLYTDTPRLQVPVGCVNSIPLHMNTLGGQRESFARASTLAGLGGLH